MTKRESLLMRLINIYPPYLGAGVRARVVDGDPYTIRVRMGLHFWNKNLFGTQFGGSLYSMCDPFFVFLLVRHLGPDYLVWDKAASIEFKKPGRGPVEVAIHVPPGRIVEIREAADRGEKVEPVFAAEIVGGGGEVVARVEKRLWVKRKGG